MTTACQDENNSIIDEIQTELIELTLDETMLTNSDDYIEKDVIDLKADIEAGLFTNEVQIGKRTVKNKQLKEEIFDSSVYVQNQCGFTTSRPLFWVNAVVKYISGEADTYGKFFCKLSKSENKYHVVKIHLCYQTTKKVEVVINLITGVFIVKGTNFKNWIEDEVPKLLTANSIPSSLITDEPNSALPTTSLNNSLDTDEYKKDQNALWEFCNRNKVAIDNHDLTVSKIQQEIGTCNSAQNNIQTELNSYKAEIEIKFDEKVMFFTETITEEMKKKCNALSQTHERNINDIKEKMGEFTTNITNRLNNFINSHKAIRDNIIEIRNLKQELEIQKHEIKRVIQEYKNFNEEEKQKMKVNNQLI